ncbi:MAG: DUF4426 domain-containing protein [Rudaea sp.]|nr:DUF4426 domain-containing protein [Rudaea sp.]
MRVAHKVGVFILAIVVLLVLLLLPRHGQGAQTQQDFGDYIVHYSAITTNQLVADVAKTYGIERSAWRGLLNIAVQAKGGEDARMVDAEVSAEVSDLTGHRLPIRLRETSENGDVDYLGEFGLNGSGTYVFTVRITPPGHVQPYLVRFNQDYVVD